MFSPTFIHFLIVIALAWTGLGALSLLILLVRDWAKGTLW